MRPDSSSAPRLALPLLSILLVAALAAPSPAVSQPNSFNLSPVNATTQNLRAGDSKTFRVELIDPSGIPIPDEIITWTILSTTAGAFGPSSSLTDLQGIASARFRFPNAGATTIEARHPLSGPVTFTVNTSAVVIAPPPMTGPLVMTAVAATQQDLVLGDRRTMAVRLETQNGTPVAGVEVKFAVVASPGSPGVGRSDGTSTTNDQGLAGVSFGFSTAGQTRIVASVLDARYIVEPASIEFVIDTASLGALAPERRSYVSAAEALDQVCLDVFVDESGNQRPTPEPTPLCVYMTGTLQDREERGTAIRELTSTGVGAQSSTSFSGLTQQIGTIQSRLAALRGGALRGAVDRIALTIDGVTISNDTLASAEASHERTRSFDTAVENGFARLYAGLDAAQDPAAGPAAVEPQRLRPWGFFVTGRLTKGDSAEGAEETGFSFDTVGVTAGIDRAVGANGFLGVALSSARNETDLNNSNGTLDNDALALTLYAIREGEHGYLQLTATAGQNSFDQTRRISLPEIGDLEAKASFDGDQLGATLELGYSFDGAASSLTMFGRGSFGRASVDGFTETGAVAEVPGFGTADFGLEVGKQEIDSLLGEAGLDWGQAFSISSGLIIPQITVAWSHEFDNDSQAIRARYLGDTAAGSSFFVFTDQPDRDWLTASAALRFQFLWGSFFVAYDREFQRDDIENRTLNAGLRFEF